MPRGAKGVKAVRSRAPPAKGGFRNPSSMLSTISTGGDQLEKSITSLCGPEYMDQLSQVTGDVNFIDLDLYKSVVDMICKCNLNLLILLDRIKRLHPKDCKEIDLILKHFDEQVKLMDFEHKAVVPKPRNPKVMDVANAYIPRNLISTPWFNDIRLMEKNVYNFINSTFLSTEHLTKTDVKRQEISHTYTWEAFSKILSDNPTISSSYRIFGISIAENQETYDYFMKIQHNANQIINALMRPMYDVEGKIEKNWDKKLSKIFKTVEEKVIPGKKQEMDKEFVIKLLVQFVCAKYRSDITGNPKYFSQMLRGGDDAMMSKINGSRFLDIMDMINTDQMDPSSRGKKFTDAAKTIMQKIVKSGDTADTKIIMEVEAILKDTTEENPDGPEDALAKLSADDASKIESLSIMFSRAEDYAKKLAGEVEEDEEEDEEEEEEDDSDEEEDDSEESEEKHE